LTGKPSFASCAQDGDGGGHEDKYTGKQVDRETGEKEKEKLREIKYFNRTISNLANLIWNGQASIQIG
jgi:hypothetical protein